MLYDELKPHNAENENLMHVENDGAFIGSLPISNKMVASIDKRVSWINIDKCDLNFESYFKVLISQDNNGNYYLGQREEIYTQDSFQGEMQ